MVYRITEVITRVLGLIIPICGLIFVLDIPIWLTGKTLFSQQYVALLWAFVSALIFLAVPASRKRSPDEKPLPKWYDFVLAGSALVAGLYVTIFYPELLFTLGLPTTLKFMLGALTVLLIFESVRRLAGWPIIIIISLFILYGRYGYLLPGIFEIRQNNWPTLMTMLYLGDDFFLGTPLQVMAMLVLPFIIFGEVLVKTGGGDFLIKLSLAVMGGFRGGPAKVAILASGLFGSISGSAVANVVSTGTVTIPLMKRVGYSAQFAGAVESVASTGGTILPPVMGAVAFVMAGFLQVSYATIALAAAIPALLYYLGLYLQVDFRAAKLGLTGRPRHELPDVKETLKEGWQFLVPLASLVLTLFYLHMSPQYAALVSALSLIIVLSFKKEFRDKVNWRFIEDLLSDTSRALYEGVVICAAAGLIIGVFTFTGLGFSLSFSLTTIAGGSLLILSILSAVTSIILGMGMPSVACYILLAVLVAPAMTQLGAVPIAAHLFILYFGVLSFITPPVALAVVAASSITETPYMQLGYQACKLAIAGFIIPFIFIYNPHLLLMGTPVEIVKAVFDAVLAIGMLAASIEGYLLRRLRWPERVLFVVGPIAMFAPGWLSSSIGLIVFLLVLVPQMIAIRAKPSASIEGQ